MPVLAAYIYSKNNELTYFHFPFSVFSLQEDSTVEAQAHKLLLKKLDELREKGEAKTLSFYANSFLVSHFFSHISKTAIRHFCEIDLSLSEETIKSNIRKSYKSLVNWGKNNMRITVCDKNNPDQEKFKQFREFHLRVAGRSTRSEESWQTQLEMIRNGEAFLITARLDEQLVSANLVMYGCKEAFYAVGVNDRDLMAQNKPISHYPLLFSVYEAKKKGLHTFNMNEIDPTGDTKKDNISTFKNGFSSTLRPSLVYEVSFSQQHLSPDA
jgi:hypothetical protein